MRHRQGLQKAGWGLMGRLVLVTGRAGVDVASGILVQRGPPKPPLDEIFSPLDAGVTGEA